MGESSSAGATKAVDMHPDFPKSITGRMLVCPEDNINTDGIYPGAYTYQELAVDEMRKVVMENYDEDFAARVEKGDILIAGGIQFPNSFRCKTLVRLVEKI
jgi:homoaconitate hydratase